MTNIIDKIAKLLALADEESGGTEAERELAMKRAQDLMLKHNLKHAEIHKTSAPGNMDEEAVIVEGAMNMWRGQLIASVSSVCFVHTIYWTLGKHRKRWVLIGRADNIAFVRTLTEHLIPWLEEECKPGMKETKAAGGNPRAFKRSFMESASYRIHSRLHEARSSSGVGTELITNERAANKEYVSNKYNVRKSSRRGGSGHAGGHAAGREAGNRADLTPGRKLNA